MGVRHRLAAAAVSLPLVLGVAGCGVIDKAAGNDPKPVTSQPAPLKAAPPPVRLTQANFVRATDAASAKATSMESVLRTSSAGQVTTMQMRMTLKPVAMTMDMSAASYGGAAHAVLLKDTLYLAAPRLAPGGKYVKIDLKTAKDPQLKALGEMMTNANPSASLKGFRKLKFVKTETLGFRKVDRYQVTVDNATALGVRRLPAGLPKTSVYTFWLGADHLVYKMLFKMGGSDVQMTVSSYNTVPTITAPPASKIYRR
jgi:hypothetical protein